CKDRISDDGLDFSAHVVAAADKRGADVDGGENRLAQPRVMRRPYDVGFHLRPPSNGRFRTLTLPAIRPASPRRFRPGGAPWRQVILFGAVRGGCDLGMLELNYRAVFIDCNGRRWRCRWRHIAQL